MRRTCVKVVFVGVTMLLCAAPVIAELRLGDGGVHNIDYEINDEIWVDYELPGLKTTVNVLDGAYIESNLIGLGDSMINIFGGRMEFLVCMDNARANIVDGWVPGIGAFGSSHIDITGNQVLGMLDVEEEGIVTIHGSDFAVDGVPIGYTELVTLTSDGVAGRLTGTLQNGDPFNANYEIWQSGRIVLVPEPTTLLLLGLGGLMLRKRRQG